MVSGHPKFTRILRVDGLLAGPPDLGRHRRREKGQSIKTRGKHEGRTSKLMNATTESEYWVVMSNTKPQEIRREKVNHSLEFQKWHNNQVEIGIYLRNIIRTLH